MPLNADEVAYITAFIRQYDKWGKEAYEVSVRYRDEGFKNIAKEVQILAAGNKADALELRLKLLSINGA